MNDGRRNSPQSRPRSAVFRALWPSNTLRTYFDEAYASGEAKLAFDTLSAAERFRFACYNLRNRTPNYGRDLSFSLDKNELTVTIRKTPIATIRKLARGHICP